MEFKASSLDIDDELLIVPDDLKDRRPSNPLSQKDQDTKTDTISGG